MAENAWEPSIVAADTAEPLNGACAASSEQRGVKIIAEEYTVKISGARSRTDTEIAAAAVNALRWRVWLQHDIRVSVSRGWVTLTGHVRRDFQRSAAGAAVDRIPGATGVSNDITLQPAARPTALIDVIQQRAGACRVRSGDRET